MAPQYSATQPVASTSQDALYMDQTNAEPQSSFIPFSSEPHTYLDFAPPGQHNSHSPQPSSDDRYGEMSNPSGSTDVAEYLDSFRRTDNHSHRYAVFDQHSNSLDYGGFGDGSLSPFLPLEPHTPAPARTSYPSGPSALLLPDPTSPFQEYGNVLREYHLQQWQALQGGLGVLQNSHDDSSVVSETGLPGEWAAPYSTDANNPIPSPDFQMHDLEDTASYDQVYVALGDLVSNESSRSKDPENAVQPASHDFHQTISPPPIIPMSKVDSRLVSRSFVSDYSVNLSRSPNNSPSDHSVSHHSQAQQIDPQHVTPGGSSSQVSRLLSTSPLQSWAQPHSPLPSPTSHDVPHLREFNAVHDNAQVTRKSILTLDAVDLSSSMEGNIEPSLSLYSISLEEQAEDESDDIHDAAGPAKKKSKMHECPVCHKKFPRPSGLRTHINTHSNAKPHACEFPGCNRSFSVRSNARRHLRTHGVDALPVRSTVKEAYVVGFSEPVIMPPPHHSISGSSDRQQQAGVDIVVKEGLDDGLGGTGGRKRRVSSFKLRWAVPKMKQSNVEVLNEETQATREVSDITQSGLQGVGTLSASLPSPSSSAIQGLKQASSGSSGSVHGPASMTSSSHTGASSRSSPSPVSTVPSAGKRKRRQPRLTGQSQPDGLGSDNNQGRLPHPQRLTGQSQPDGLGSDNNQGRLPHPQVRSFVQHPSQSTEEPRR